MDLLDIALLLKWSHFRVAVRRQSGMQVQSSGDAESDLASNERDEHAVDI